MNWDKWQRDFDADWEKSERRFDRMEKFFSVAIMVWAVVAIAWVTFLIWAGVQLIQLAQDKL